MHGRRLALHDLAVDDLRATKRHEMLAFREAPLRHVGDEPRARIAVRFGLLLVLRHFDDAAAIGSVSRLLRREEQVADDARLRDEAGLDRP